MFQFKLKVLLQAFNIIFLLNAEINSHYTRSFIPFHIPKLGKNIRKCSLSYQDLNSAMYYPMIYNLPILFPSLQTDPVLPY